MRFVYAMRLPPKLEFAVANQREAIPVNGEVLAICDGAMTIRQQNSQSLCVLTPQEQLVLEHLIIESEVSEKAAGIAQGAEPSMLRRFCRKLLKI